MGPGAVKVFCQSREKSLPPAHSVYEVRHQRMLLRFGRCCDICGQYRRRSARPSRKCSEPAHIAIPSTEGWALQAKGRRQPSATMAPCR